MATIEVRKYQYKDKNGETRTGEKYKATVTVTGFPRTSKMFERKTDARDWANKTEYEFKHQRSFGHAHHKQKTLNDAIRRYEQSLKLSNPKRHKQVWPMLEWWGKKIGGAKLSELTKDQIILQRDRLKTNHVRNNPKLPNISNARVNRCMATLSRVLTVAADEWDWIAKNPMLGIQNLPEPSGRTRFLQDEELNQLVAAAKQSENPDMYAIIVLAITTGARRGEIERIRFKDVSLTQKKILLPITKNKKPRMLHLVEPAYSLIKAIYERPRPDCQEYMFASPFEASRHNCFRRAWNTAVRRAELKDFRFHDLRHTAASFLAQHGAGLHQISEILGHSSFQVTKRYIHMIEKNTVAIIESTAAKVFSHDQQLSVGGKGEVFLPHKA